MTDLYLILHKVRGEPAFDIAQKIIIGSEEGWIVPTSGHRAYPAAAWPLSELEGDLGRGFFEAVYNRPDNVMASDKWDDHPDHFGSRREETGAMEELARSALLRRGLLKTKPVNNYRRR